MHLTRLRTALLVTAFVLTAGRALAQEAPAAVEAPTVPDTPAAPQPPAPVPAPEIFERSEKLRTGLKQIELVAAPDATEIEIGTKLPEFAARLLERQERANDVLGGVASRETLSDLSSAWGARSERLGVWRQALTRRAIAIETEIEKLDLSREIWEITRSSAGAAGLPGSAKERVAETLQAIKAARKLLQRRRLDVLALQNEVSQEELVVSGVLDRVADRQKQLQSRLFTRDQPPLWSGDAYVRSADTPPVAERLRASVGDRLGEFTDYAALEYSRYVWQAGVFGLVLIALLLARSRVLLWAAEDSTLTAAARIFTRPFSSAIVVSTLGTQFAAAKPPAVATDVEALVLLVPILRLLPRELYGGLRIGVFGLALLFVLGSLPSLDEGVPILQRYRLLLETLGGVALFAWMLRPDNTRHFGDVGRFGPMILPACRIALALLVGAMLANAAGMISASRLLVRGTLSASYVAVAAYALARILGGAVTAVLRSTLLRRLRLVRDHGGLVRRRIVAFVYWAAVLGWVLATLRFFDIDDEILSALAGVVLAKLEIGTLSVSIGDVLAFFVTVWLAFMLSKFLRFVLDEDVLPHIALPRGVPAAISTGVHYVILLIGFTLAIGAAGIDLSRFGLLAGAFGVGIGFGLQNVVNNFVSGLILLFERPVQTGDTIEIGDLIGDVKRIGIRSSTVRTIDGADVIVPNANLISERVVNWTFSDRQRRVDLAVGVAYGTDPEQVIELLVAVGRAHLEVLDIPEPIALFTGFGDSSLDFSLRFWTRFEIFPRVRSEIAVGVNTALREAGIEIPFPQRDVHLKSTR